MHILLFLDSSLSLYKPYPLHIELLYDFLILHLLVLFVPQHLGLDLLHYLLPYHLRLLVLVQYRLNQHPLSSPVNRPRLNLLLQKLSPLQCLLEHK